MDAKQLLTAQEAWKRRFACLLLEESGIIFKNYQYLLIFLYKGHFFHLEYFLLVDIFQLRLSDEQKDTTHKTIEDVIAYLKNI